MPLTPHSLYCFPAWLETIRSNSILSKFKVLVSRVSLFLPFVGIILKKLGFEGVNKENFLKYMKKNENIAFVPGGYEEATLTNNEKYPIY